jgi:hypothetical protein
MAGLAVSDSFQKLRLLGRIPQRLKAPLILPQSGIAEAMP